MKSIIKKTLKKVLPWRARHYIRAKILHQYDNHDSDEVGIEDTPSTVKPLTYGQVSHFILADVTNDSNLDILYVFPVIDWDFRFQRPQHFARGFARQDYKVFYFTTSFNQVSEFGYTIRNIENNVFEVRLNVNCEVNIYTSCLGDELKQFWIKSIGKFEADFGIVNKFIKLDHPFWINLARDLGGKIIYDCMDDHEGFEDGLEHIVALEQKAIQLSDYLIVSSDKLYQKFAPIHSNCVLIENACDFDFFSKVKNTQEIHELKAKLSGKGVIGYFGAIANWFDLECLEYLVQQFSDYDFILIGHTNGCEDINKLSSLNNVHLLGEKPYSELPAYLNLFDVCLIPFKIIPLTLATNPVKMFEYLSQGKAVVSTALPEVLKYSSVVYTAQDKFEFVQKIKQAFAESEDINLINSRIEVARNNSWSGRFNQLTNFISNSVIEKPRVSVIVLTYNNLSLTKNCLYSLDKYSNYDNLEVIVVDNLSSDGSREWLCEYAKHKTNFKLILNNINAGFSAGNNIGIKQSTGAYIVVLNNDTFVSPNWVNNLLRHFNDEKVGMVGPVTNNIGNQAKIPVPSYFTEADFLKHATRIHYANYGKVYPMIEGSLAFFCVVIKKEVIDAVGLLDENFGRGWFEDDDYTIRVREAGYQAIIADDVLIHHEHSATFGKLPNQEKLDLFDKNKAYFEQKHNMKWIPHETER